MSNRIFNFSAGPAMLPTEVLEKSATALVDFQGKGFGIAEVSHRGKALRRLKESAEWVKLFGTGATAGPVSRPPGSTG